MTLPYLKLTKTDRATTLYTFLTRETTKHPSGYKIESQDFVILGNFTKHIILEREFKCSQYHIKHTWFKIDINMPFIFQLYESITSVKREIVSLIVWNINNLFSVGIFPSKIPQMYITNYVTFEKVDNGVYYSSLYPEYKFIKKHHVYHVKLNTTHKLINRIKNLFNFCLVNHEKVMPYSDTEPNSVSIQL